MGGSLLFYIGLIFSFGYMVTALLPLELNKNIVEMNISKKVIDQSIPDLDFKNTVSKSEYKTIEVYDNTNENSKNINGILFTLNDNRELFIPDKNDLGDYLLINNKGPLEVIKNDFIYRSPGTVIGSYSFSGNTSTGDILNTITGNVYCSFDNSTNDCN